MAEQESDSRTPRTEQLERVIADYLEACEAGRKPDRRRILDANPDLATDLEAFFAEHDRVHALGAPLPAARSATAEAKARQTAEEARDAAEAARPRRGK